MRKLFFLFVLLQPMLMARAASDGINAMLLQGPSDFRFTILLDDQPVVTFSDDYLVVTTHMGNAVSIPSNLVARWTYVKDENATRIGNASKFGSVLSFDGKYISMKNLAPASAVQVSYTNMQAGKTYTAYPTVKIMGKELRAEPSKDFPELLTCPDDNHPHAIDLGLPSGTKWCCCNVGASTPEGYGGYYAWGETWEKNVYDWDTYAYGSSWDNCVNIGSDIAGTSYDAATVNMGAPWRMPSHNQQVELINNCSYQWTTQNGVNGILVTGRNGSQIFLPAAGYRWRDYLDNAGSNGYYWSSSLHPGNDSFACSMDFGSGYWGWYGNVRYYGLSVRAVCP